MTKKTPYFQFYPADFLVGSATMTAEGRGAYIVLLCHAWEGDGVPDDPRILKSLTGASPRAIAEAKAKFYTEKDGKLRNRRLEETRAKLNEYCEQQRQKALKRWENKDATAMPRDCHGNAEAYAERMPRECHTKAKAKSIAYTQHASDFERPSIKEVSGYAATIGLVDWKAVDFFQEMEACGWLDYQSRPLRNWQAALSRVQTKWRADGAPMTPAKGIGKEKNGSSTEQKPNGTNGQTVAWKDAGQPTTPWEIKTTLEAVRDQRKENRGLHRAEAAMGHLWDNDDAKALDRKLGKRAKELQEKLTGLET